jgi:hypothetical protein
MQKLSIGSISNGRALCWLTADAVRGVPWEPADR